MKQICYFSGWFEVTEDMQFQHIDSMEVKTVKEWADAGHDVFLHKEKFIIVSFAQSYLEAENFSLEECYISSNEEDESEDGF